MSGHNKWSKIKHKKAKTDAQKGKLFTIASKEIIAAAQIGGIDPDLNPRLRLAIQNAKSVNMPNDNINRALERASKKDDGSNYEENLYEGYAASGVAVIVETLTDNRNRTASEVRSTFTKQGGNMGEPGSVGWMFKKRSRINFINTTEDELMEKLLDAEIEDIEATEENGSFDVYAAPEAFNQVLDYLKEKSINYQEAELTMIPDNYITVEDIDTAKKILQLIEKLEELDDVKTVYTNMDLPDQIAEQLEE